MVTVWQWVYYSQYVHESNILINYDKFIMFTLG